MELVQSIGQCRCSGCVVVNSQTTTSDLTQFLRLVLCKGSHCEVEENDCEVCVSLVPTAVIQLLVGPYMPMD